MCMAEIGTGGASAGTEANIGLGHRPPVLQVVQLWLVLSGSAAGGMLVLYSSGHKIAWSLIPAPFAGTKCTRNN